MSKTNFRNENSTPPTPTTPTTSLTLVCDSSQRTEATKVYNRDPQEKAERPYQFIHTDLVGPITPLGFGGEHYFFTFTNDYTRYTKTYTGAQKSDWFRCLKEFHNLAKTCFKEPQPTERL